MGRIISDLSGTRKQTFEIDKAKLDSSALSVQRDFSLPDQSGEIQLSRLLTGANSAISFPDGIFTVGGSAQTLAANTVYFARLNSHERKMLRYFKYRLDGVSASEKINIGIWDALADSLEYEMGATTTPTNGYKTVDKGSDFELSAGVKLLIWTVSSASNTMRGYSASITSVTTLILNQVSAQFGYFTNPSSAGVFPGTTGGLVGASIPAPLIGITGG